MRKILATILLVSLLPSCAMVRKAEAALDKINAIAEKTDVSMSDVNRVTAGLKVAATAFGEKGEELVDKVEEVRKTFMQADKNGDGRIAGFAEWKDLLYALGILVVGWFTKKGVDQKVEKVDERLTRSKRDLHERITKEAHQ